MAEAERIIRENLQREFAERISREVEVEQRGLAERLSREYKIKFDRGPCRASARLVVVNDVGQVVVQ